MCENDVTLGRVDDSVKSAHKRIDELDKRLDSKIDSVSQKVDNLTTLTTAVATLQLETKDIKLDVSEIKTDLKQVTARPAKWWDKLIAAAIGACASGIIAAILTQILK